MFDIPHLPDAEEAIFFLLEFAFFVENEGGFISFPKNDIKVVSVLEEG